MTYTYAEDGSRVPFDPLRIGQHLAGCCLCGRRVSMVGVFTPATDQMRAAVLLLRQHPLPDGRAAGTAYGLCRRHAADPHAAEQVEAAILAAAEKVTVQ